MLNELLKQTAVIGAAGKMGNGISLLLLQEMAKTELEQTGKVGSGEYCLTLIDVNDKALITLRQYLRSQMLKYAERNINRLRQSYAGNPKLISNEEIIRAFVEGSCDIIRLETELTGAKNAALVFEAIIEDVTIKTSVYNILSNSKKREQYYFTNTSSIPISVLNKASKLDNRIIGYHFYNPPVVQKLLEIIAPEQVNPQLLEISIELAKRLQKKVIPSHDVTGFIGNGHFLREMLFAGNQVRNLKETHGFPLSKAIYLINRVTHDFLLRPMGIFQLMDYVGIDICQNIAKIMSTYLNDPSLHDDLIDSMVASKHIGGQFPDGSQKNGFFQYEHHVISGIYSLDDKQYHLLAKEPWVGGANSFLGERPDAALTWKALQNDNDKKIKLEKYFQDLSESDSEGAKLAMEYLTHSKKIAQDLVKARVADNIDDVDAVLELGFYHLYGVSQVAVAKKTPLVVSTSKQRK